MWALSAQANRFAEINEEEAVERLQRLISKNKSSNKYSFWRWASIAAAIAGICFYFLYNQSGQSFLVKTNNGVVPDTLNLADGTMLVLAPGAEVKYPTSFADERDIILTKGQVFFDVAKNGTHPFNVLMQQSKIRVMGTSFNVNLKDSQIEVAVKTGKVSFEVLNDALKSVLYAGDAISYNRTEKMVTQISPQNADAWVTKRLIFVDTPLDSVCNQLSNYYQVAIELKFDDHGAKRLNARFEGRNLLQVLEVLKQTYQVNIAKKNNKIIITKL